jgi:hypothetical protein
VDFFLADVVIVLENPGIKKGLSWELQEACKESEQSEEDEEDEAVKREEIQHYMSIVIKLEERDLQR